MSMSRVSTGAVKWCYFWTTVFSQVVQKQ